MDQRVAVRARHAFVDLGDDLPRRLRRGERGVDRRAQGAVAVPVRRRQLQERDVERNGACEVNSVGMSERKTGTKSARPSSMASRTGAPVNSDTERNRPSLRAPQMARARSCAGDRARHRRGPAGGQGFDQRSRRRGGAVDEDSHAAL